VSICQQLEVTEYISGPSARDYIDKSLFSKAGLRIVYMDYHGYPVYRQLNGLPFQNEVSILDLIFNEGPNAKFFMKSFSGFAPDEQWSPKI
jgi:hypothetical protein